MFNISITIIELLSVFVFGIPFFDDNVFSYAMIIIFAVLMNFVFIAYDYSLKMCLVLYIKKFEKRIKKMFRQI